MISNLAAMLLAAGSAMAESPPARPAAPAASLQSQFDSATAAHDAGRYDEAVRGFEALEKLPGVQRSALVLGTIRLRKGIDLARMERLEEGESTLRLGLKGVPSDRPELRRDRFLAEMELGNLAIAHLDYAAATEEFKRALDLADDVANRTSALVALGCSTMFDPGDAAIRYADQALAIVAAQVDSPKKTNIANLQTLRARAMLNHGLSIEAYALLKKAVTNQGGLDLKVGAAEIVTRSDLAIAALLSGKRDDARHYLAYTGAGRIERAPFQTAVHMLPPPCGGPANLQPDDVAVVEFSIRADGSVGRVTPVYASTNGQAAFEFARAVTGWSWRSEQVAKIPELFRLITRVELRCSTSAQRPPIGQALAASLDKWLLASHAPPAAEGASDAARFAPLKAELARRQATGGGISAIPVLLALGRETVATPDDRQMWLTQARDLAIRAGAPLPALMSIETQLAAEVPLWRKSGAVTYRSQLRTLLDQPGVAADAVVANTLKLLIAEPIVRAQAPSDASVLLRQVIDDDRLGRTNPLRIGALVRLAALQAEAGDIASAAATYQQSGLSSQQCALIDAKPALLHMGLDSGDYPTAALEMGFEGWVRLEYDIEADGRTAAQRAIIAYPPFVFRDAAVGVAKNFTYTKSYRPDGATACGGEQQNLNFRIPH